MTIEYADIHTGRLLLRRLVEADRETVLRIQTDPRTNRYNPGPRDIAEHEAKFESWLEDWAEHGFCYVAVIEKATQRFLGLGGLQLRQFGGQEILNLYYRFLPEAWGRGFATETSSAVIAWADGTLPQYPVQISVNVANRPSLKVAERLGFQTYTETFYAGALTRHFRRA